jgi:uncharacterized protein YdeI (YjbR/CyaY-like superfamily)
MSEFQLHPKVDEFLSKQTKWQSELMKLRELVLACELTEELKWGQPCYTKDGKNIVIISGFKDYFALNFFKGALLKDELGILISPGENSQASRQIRFLNIEEVDANISYLTAYILEAIEVEKAGLDVVYKKDSEYETPEELTLQFNEDDEFRKAFEALTPGRRRYYLIYFSESKQAKTRLARIAKYRDRILEGKGFNDCTCGLSQKMPGCDGSHKQLKAN